MVSARRAMEGLHRIGQPFLGFAYEEDGSAATRWRSPASRRRALGARRTRRASTTPPASSTADRTRLRNWQVDVWHAETPFGKAYFPDTCLEGTSEAAAKASASNTELLGEILQASGRASPGDLINNKQLQIETTLNYFRGHDHRGSAGYGVAQQRKCNRRSLRVASTVCGLSGKVERNHAS